MLPRSDIIAAIATGPGQGGIGVVRVSGANLAQIQQGLTGRELEPRLACYTPFLDENLEVIDQGIALYFAAPNSFTGEDVLEFQGHGGPAVLLSILNRCISLGARLAQPGEFTQRAFLNGKLDLAQAESVADLIAATTQQAAKSAVRSLCGDFSSAIRSVLNKIIELRAYVEAHLDFPEEEGVVAEEPRILREKLLALRGELLHIQGLATQGNILREGAQVVLIGAPNVGKSSLLNRLSGEEVALVSDIPGTTRDSIRQTLQINGIPLHLVDTAGIRQTDDVLEQMGIGRTRQSLEKADLALVLIDDSNPVPVEEIIGNLEVAGAAPRLFIHNKIDLVGKPAFTEMIDGVSHLYLSAKTGEGIQNLKDAILKATGWHHEEGVFMARSRHLTAISDSLDALQGAEEQLSTPELFAESLRQAQLALNQITGEFVADDLLGEIFGKFCIGK